MGPPAITAVRKAARSPKSPVRDECRRLLELLSPADFADEHRQLLRKLVPKKGSDPIRLAGELIQSLKLTAWNRLSPQPRKSILAELTAELRNVGYEFRETAIQRYGPRSDSQPIAQWRDANGLRFVLIPGGSFRPGFDDVQLRKLSRIGKQIQRDKGEGELNPRRVQVFDSASTCDVRQKREVTVVPMLMAAELVEDARSSEGFKGLKKRQGQPSFVNLHDLATLLGERRWTLPSSDELEWAIRGGRKILFHWDDRPGRFIEQEFVDAERDETKWPFCTRFGLTAPLDYQTWCQPGSGSHPIVTRGGSATPWQGCFEWTVYLTAVSSRKAVVNEGIRFAACVRPVIRLAGNR